MIIVTPEQDGEWSWANPSLGEGDSHGLNVAALVDSLTDEREAGGGFGEPTVVSPLVAATPGGPFPTLMPHPALVPAAMMPPALMPPALMPAQSGGGKSSWQPYGGAPALVHSHQPVATRDMDTSIDAVGEAQGAAESNSEGPPFEWTPCRCPLRIDPNGAPLASASGTAGEYGVQVALQTPLLYWNERVRWMWHGDT